jgi:hypothetical protein
MTLAQWYARYPRCGAIYVRSWSLHWAIRDLRMVIKDGHYAGWEEVEGGPYRCIVLYRGVFHEVFRIRLWRMGRTKGALGP